MEAFLVLVAVGLALVVAGAVGVAWWEQRRYVASSPFEPQRAETGRAAAPPPRNAAASVAPPALTAPKRNLAGVASAPPAATVATLRDEILTGAGWADTQPMIGQGASPSFAETMPFDLEMELPDFGSPAPGHARDRQPA